ncbi:response regulator, partial [Lacticaseibacillus rhamnosus]
VLQIADYEVWQARGLAEAKEQLARATPALVLLDLRLGDGDGLDLAMQIRADGKHPRSPILALSADAPPGAARRAPATGLNTTEVREWAKSQGMDVKDRGRVPAELVVKFTTDFNGAGRAHIMNFGSKTFGPRAGRGASGNPRVSAYVAPR